MRWCRILLVLMAIPVHAAYAVCPTTSCNLYHGSVTVSSSPEGTAGMFEQSFFGQSRTDVSWNAPLGDLAVVGSYLSGTAFPSGEVATTDDFEILGASPGVPVRVIVKLEGSGSNIQSGIAIASFRGTLSDATGRSVDAGPEPPNVLRLALPVDFVTGSPQRITYRLWGFATNFPVSAHARLLFDGLPAGMSIVSCRGFQSGAVTAARSTTWGRLKQLYR